MKIKFLTLRDIFADLFMGDFHASNEIAAGKYPLISCSAEDNGIEGYFDLPSESLYKNAVTIASDGSPLTAFYHDYHFGAKDNVIVCIPRLNTKIETIYYILYQIRRLKWRFSYGRKCYFNKIDKLSFPFPVNSSEEIDQEYIAQNFPVDFKSRMPSKTSIFPITTNLKFGEFELQRLFNIDSGEYHSASDMDEGKIPLISCGEKENGLVGFFNIPEDKRHSNAITIAYNGSPMTTKFHPYQFGAKDDVAVCDNTNNLKLTTILFISAVLNRMTWRFSYGRKCFKEKVKVQKIPLPITSKGEIDEASISSIVENTPYFKYFVKQNSMRS